MLYTDYGSSQKNAPEVAQGEISDGLTVSRVWVDCPD